jgi:dephospho-CoA kinase
MLFCGMTGSIAMGKSTTAAMFRRRGIPVHDADATVHRLYRGRAAPLIEAEFPGSTKDGVVDRASLSALVLNEPARLARLEEIVHALVAEEESRFRDVVRARGDRLAVLDIPLLFETGADRRVDFTLVVTADAAIQRNRVLERPGMTPEKFQAILNRQMPDAQKRRRAHFLIDTGLGIDAADRQVGAVLAAVAPMT